MRLLIFILFTLTFNLQAKTPEEAQGLVNRDGIPIYDNLSPPIVCINGVSYYYTRSSSYSLWSDSTYARAFLTPVINKDTLSYERCVSRPETSK